LLDASAHERFLHSLSHKDSTNSQNIEYKALAGRAVTHAYATVKIVPFGGDQEVPGQ